MEFVENGIPGCMKFLHAVMAG
jgi:hypothetical protein